MSVLTSTFRTIAFVCVASLPSLIAACSSPDAEDGVDELDGALVQFDAPYFTEAPTLTYGEKSPPIETSRTKWGAIRWDGFVGDAIVASVEATMPDRMPRTYLVERRADGKFVSVTAGTQSADGIVRATLARTGEYFIAFRDSNRRNATFTVRLERANVRPQACTGKPLVLAGIVARTRQGDDPGRVGLTTSGTFRTTVRRCNASTGCDEPFSREMEMDLKLSKINDTWTLESASEPSTQATLDVGTGALHGVVSVPTGANHVRSVEFRGMATTGCISFSSRQRLSIDKNSYHDVELDFMATTPPVQPRTTYPQVPPQIPCDGERPLPDVELLGRFPAGASEIPLWVGEIMKASQICHPLTGCRPWEVRRVGYIGGTVNVLEPNQLGIKLGGRTYVVDDGIIDIPSGDKVFQNRSVDVIATISDKHLLIKEADVYTQGEFDGEEKSRVYTCMAVPPHP